MCRFCLLLICHSSCPVLVCCDQKSRNCCLEVCGKWRAKQFSSMNTGRFPRCSLLVVCFSCLLLVIHGPGMVVADGYTLKDMGISAEIHDHLSKALARAAGVYHRPETSESQSWLMRSYPRLNRTVLVTASNYGYLNHLQVTLAYLSRFAAIRLPYCIYFTPHAALFTSNSRCSFIQHSHVSLTLQNFKCWADRLGLKVLVFAMDDKTHHHLSTNYGGPHSNLISMLWRNVHTHANTNNNTNKVTNANNNVNTNMNRRARATKRAKGSPARRGNQWRRLITQDGWCR